MNVVLFMNLITDYIISLSSLYGLVHKEKVAEIYNMKNEEEITLTQIERIMENEQAMLEKHFVYEIESLISRIMNLVVNLGNNTRLWSNNRYTPRELFVTDD